MAAAFKAAGLDGVRRSWGRKLDKREALFYLLGARPRPPPHRTRYHVGLDLNGLLRSARSLGSHHSSICSRTTSPNPAEPDRSFDTDCPTLQHLQLLGLH